MTTALTSPSRLYEPEYASFASYAANRLALMRKECARAGVELSRPTTLIDGPGGDVIELSDPQHGELAAARRLATRLAAQFGR